MDMSSSSGVWGQDATVNTPTIPPVTTKKRKALRITPRRKSILSEFIAEISFEPRRYGRFEGSAWMRELIERFGEAKGRAGTVTEFDVRHWLRSNEFVGVYERAKEIYSRSVTPEPNSPQPGSSTSPALVPSEERNETIHMETDESQDGETGQPAQYAHMNAEVNQVQTTRPLPKLYPISQIAPAYQREEPYQPEPAYQTAPNYQTESAYQPEPAYQREQHYQPEPAYQTELTYQPDQYETEGSSRFQVTVRSNGILLNLPPIPGPTTLFLQPTAWTVTALPDDISTYGDTTASPMSSISDDGFKFDTNTMDGETSDQEEPYDLSGGSTSGVFGY